MTGKLAILAGIVFVLTGCQEDVTPEQAQFSLHTVTREVKDLSVAAGGNNINADNSRGVTIKRNPFLTMEEIEFFGKDYREIVEDLNLTAIFYSPGNSYAVIDGRVVKEKDVIGDKKITAMAQEEVFLEDLSGKKYLIQLKNVINQE